MISCTSQKYRRAYDPSLKTFFVAELFPPQHEAAHVEIAEQR
jgi:hypothetical protein